jgi:hypothetical protein
MVSLILMLKFNTLAWVAGFCCPVVSQVCIILMNLKIILCNLQLIIVTTRENSYRCAIGTSSPSRTSEVSHQSRTRQMSFDSQAFYGRFTSVMLTLYPQWLGALPELIVMYNLNYSREGRRAACYQIGMKFCTKR